MTISSKSLRKERRLKSLRSFFTEGIWWAKTIAFILIMGTLASTMFWLPLMVFTVVFGGK